MLALSMQLVGAAKMMQIVAGQQPKPLEITPNGAFLITGGVCLIITDVTYANGELVVPV